MNRFENKVVVITGAAGGIGEATTRRIVSEGGKVVIADHSEKRAEQLANELWHETMRRMLEAAVPLCEHDEPLGGNQRLRLGMFCYAEAMEGTEDKTLEKNEK